MKFKFDQIAINSTAKKTPVPEDAAHYIGLEHLIPGTFEIPEWGAEVAPVGEKLLMKKGDVLFGRRRAYQRKVGIAPFDGIFSAHGMVLRPRTEVVDEKYFPFFIASNQFMEEAIRISVGSLSPTINWGTLKNCEFDLPPLDEQKRLAELLWSANDLKEKYKKAIAASNEMLKAKFREMFVGVSRKLPLGDVATYVNGMAFKPSDWDTEGLPIIRIQNLTGSGEKYNYYKGGFPKSVEVNVGDILISWSATLGVFVWTGEKAILNQHIFKVVFDKIEVDRDYFIYAVSQALPIMCGLTHGSTMTHIVKSAFDTFEIPFPENDKQREIGKLYKKVGATNEALRKAIVDIDIVIKGLING